MIQKVFTLVSVSFYYDAKKKKAFPKWLVWEERLYPVVKLGLHHSFYKGRTLFHVFSVASKTLFFRLIFNTENLSWRLEEISDGLPD